MESNQTSATVERARQYFSEVHAHDLPALPASIRERVTAELLRHGEALLGIVDDIFLPVPASDSERGRAAAALLAEVPESQRARSAHRHRDQAWAVATIIGAIGDDSATTVARWLQAAKRAPVNTYTVFAKPWEHGWELHIAGVGVTQSHTLDDAEMMARDLIAINEDVPADSFAVEIRPEVLTAEQREVAGQALGDALARRDDEAGKPCRNCAASPAGLCEDHAEDLDRLDAYRALARELDIEVPR